MKIGLTLGMAMVTLGALALPKGFVVAEGDHLATVDGAGRKSPIVLKGTNAGSWLLVENWMSPTSLTANFKGENGQYELEEALVAKHGAAKAAELWKVYRDTWWQEADFDNVKALGLNCLRVPFGWRDFLDEQGATKKEGFVRLDWFIKNCQKRGIYVILDLHGGPGSQNGRHHSGDTRSPRLFKDEAMMGLCCRLWQALATKYKGNPTVAAYDLLNEPEGHPGGHTTSPEVIDGLNQLYQAVRKVDADHVVMVESCWDTAELPAPSKYGWKNVCYEYHFYCWNGINNYEKQKKFIESKLANEARTHHGVPVFIGEFNFFDDVKSWDLALSTFNAQGWSWTTWSYKVYQARSSWGIYNGPNRSKSNVVTPDDDFATAKAKWSKCGTKEAFHENQWLAEVIRKNAK